MCAYAHSELAAPVLTLTLPSELEHPYQYPANPSALQRLSNTSFLTAAHDMASRRPSVDIPFDIAIFHDKLEKLTVIPEKDREGWQGQPFVRGRALTAWLESSATFGQRVTYTALLLDKLFVNPDTPLPISDNEILRGDERCPLMFCILLQMGRGELVKNLHKCGLNDSCLPMSLAQLRHLFKEAFHDLGGRQSEVLADEFHDKQWMYFPLRITRDMRPLPLPPQMVLPICQRSEINSKGGTAKLHMITIHEDFIDDKIKQAVPDSAFEDAKYGRCFQFALKSFINHSRRMFEAEIEAYRHLRNQEHVIKCFGGFSHWGDNDRSRTYSILLEYGQCDLAEYFCHVDPPALPEDIEDFWLELFKVVMAVKDIHSYRAPRGAKTVNYDGWHGDIKPDNILMSERQLKLADPGFVNFVRSNDSQSRNETLRRLNGWTSTYASPELKQSQAAVCEPWAVDMWSLGCVISEAATWIVLAESGRDAYATMRRDAIRSYNSGPYPYHQPDAEPGYGDCFHNGHTVLPDVTQWHQTLRSMIRSSDHITGKVLDLVDAHLLVTEPKDRMQARPLCLEFDKIKAAAQHSRALNATPRTIRNALRQVREQGLETWVSPSQIFGGLSIEDRKAANLTAPAIMSYISRSSGTIKRTRSNAPQPSMLPTITVGNEQSQFEVPEPRRLVPQNSEPLLRPPTRTNTGTVPVDPLFTVFDAHYERRAAEGKLMNRFTKSSRKKKDLRLSSYYKDRDIVFMIDNSYGMLQYWQEVKFTLTELVGKARNQDEDGIDMIFTRSDVAVRNAKRDALEQCVKAIDSVTPQHGVQTDMADTLGRMLFRWRDTFRRDPTGTKNMTIIILTDGRWASSSENDEYAVDERIVHFSKSAMQLPDFREQKRRVSIQFVSFGHDAMALARLQRLDDSLRYANIEDIVDTEPSSGDVYKMLVGSFISEIDETLTSPSMIETSPPQLQWSSSNFTLDSPAHSRGSDISIPRLYHSQAGFRDSVPMHPYPPAQIIQRPESIHRSPRVMSAEYRPINR